MPQPRYRLYIDESGDHTFKQVDKPERRYLALLGIWFDTGPPYLRFARELQALKDETFGPRLGAGHPGPVQAVLRGHDATGDVLAESRGKTEDQQLKEAFVSIYNNGTRFHPATSFSKVLTSGEIKLKKKTHCIAGLELADLLASPIRRQVVAENSGETVPVDFGSRLVQMVEDKFNCHLYDGRIGGYGKVWLT